jgi:hypothetical protein
MAMAAPNLSNNNQPINFEITLNQPAQITLNLYSLMGQEVYSTTIQGVVGANNLLWTLRNKAQEKVASGLYVYSLAVSGNGLQEKKIGKVVILH